MAELVAAVPELLRPEQGAQHYAEAVVTAVAACAADTAGQTCYICYGEGDEEEGLVRGCSCRGESGFAHVSCLARQAQVAVERGGGPRFDRWYSCGLCEQEYHGDVRCALGWACWKTYLGRPEESLLRREAMKQLGNGLYDAYRACRALSVREAHLSLLRRIGAPEGDILAARGNLARTYRALGRSKEALRIVRDAYSKHCRLLGEDSRESLALAENYASSLGGQGRYGEAKALLRKTIPVARRVLGESHILTLRMRWAYARALYADSGTLDDLRAAEAALRTTRRVLGGGHPMMGEIERGLQRKMDDLRDAMKLLDETVLTARRVLGGAHPLAAGIEVELRDVQAAFRDRLVFLYAVELDARSSS